MVSTGRRRPVSIGRVPPQRDPWPDDVARERAVVAVLVHEIHLSDDDDRDEMLGEMLRAAWPTERSESQ